MNMLTAAAGTAVSALALALAAAGCSSSGTSTDNATTAPATSVTSEAAPPEATTSAPQAAPGQTLDDYIAEAGLQKTVIRPGDPGPTIDLPVPQGWARADATADAPYGGLVFSHPVSGDDPPRINARLFKLTGQVDPARVLMLAPTTLKSLPGFETLGDAEDELGGFKAAQAGGRYTRDGNSRLVAQKSVVIPTDGGVFVYQLSADGLESDAGVLMDATSVIDKETKITP